MSETATQAGQVNDGIEILAASHDVTQAQARLMAHVQSMAVKLGAAMQANAALAADLAKLREAFEKRTLEHDAAVKRCDELAAKCAELDGIATRLAAQATEAMERANAQEKIADKAAADVLRLEAELRKRSKPADAGDPHSF